MKHKNKAQSKQIDEKLFKKVFSIKNTNSPELIKIGSKYFLAEVLNVNKEKRKLNDPEVFKIINTQLEFQNKIQDNSSLLKDISMGGFDNEKLTLFAKQHNLEIKDYKVSDLKQNDIFSEGVIKRIFLTKDKEINLITNSNFTKNYLIFTKKTEFKKMKKDKSEIEKYEAKARLELINNIYKIFDDRLNQKYKVKLNQRTIERVKNSF